MKKYILVNYPGRNIFKEGYDTITGKNPNDALNKHFGINFKKASSCKCDYLIRNNRGFLGYVEV